MNHGLATKLTTTDPLLGRFYSYKKLISSLSARSFCKNVILTLFQENPTLA